MRAAFGGILAAALAGCAPSAYDKPLSGLDLGDPATLSSLQNALPLDDRGALGTYALLHWPKSKFYCGKPIGGRGDSEVATVREAIALTRTYEREWELARQNVAQTPAIARQRDERMLITRMDHLILERDKLFSEVGPRASATPRAEEIERKLAAVRAELDKLRSAETS